MPATKVELNHNKVMRTQDLDEFAALVFPNNRNHQRLFLAVFVELKWAGDQFLPTLEFIADEHRISRRTLNTVRAKMRRLGLIDHVSRFNKRHGYREGWVFSNRFERTLRRLAGMLEDKKTKGSETQEKKERALLELL